MFVFSLRPLGGSSRLNFSTLLSVLLAGNCSVTLWFAVFDIIVMICRCHTCMHLCKENCYHGTCWWWVRGNVKTEEGGVKKNPKNTCTQACDRVSRKGGYHSHMHKSEVWRGCNGYWRIVGKGMQRRWGEKTPRGERFCFQQPLKKTESSTSLVMVLLIESGLAEEPRATLGCAGGKGHGLQHCIGNDRDNSQDKTRQTQCEKSRLLQRFSTG